MSQEETNSEVLNSIYTDEKPIPVIYQIPNAFLYKRE